MRLTDSQNGFFVIYGYFQYYGNKFKGVPNEVYKSARDLYLELNLNGIISTLNLLLRTCRTISPASKNSLILAHLYFPVCKKVKAVCGSYSTAALRHIVLLPERVPSFISRGAAHTKRHERPLLAKEGTIPGI